MGKWKNQALTMHPVFFDPLNKKVYMKESGNIDSLQYMEAVSYTHLGISYECVYDEGRLDNIAERTGGSRENRWNIRIRPVLESYASSGKTHYGDINNIGSKWGME